MVEAGQPLVYFEVPELEAQAINSRPNCKRLPPNWTKPSPRPAGRSGGGQGCREQCQSPLAALEGRGGGRNRAGPPPPGGRGSRRAIGRAQSQRTTRLSPKGAASLADQDVAVASKARSLGKANAAPRRAEIAGGWQPPQGLAEAAAELDWAKAQSDLLQAGTRVEDCGNQGSEAEAQAKLRELEVKLAEAVILAPGKAIIEVVSVRQGDVVAAGQPVVRVLRAEDLWVKVFVPETELGKIRLGDRSN